MRFPNHRLAQLFTLLQNETLPQDELARAVGFYSYRARRHYRA